MQENTLQKLPHTVLSTKKNFCTFCTIENVRNARARFYRGTTFRILRSVLSVGHLVEECLPQTLLTRKIFQLFGDEYPVFFHPNRR